jgi:hypothetical protein
MFLSESEIVFSRSYLLADLGILPDAEVFNSEYKIIE